MNRRRCAEAARCHRMCRRGGSMRSCHNARSRCGSASCRVCFGRCVRRRSVCAAGIPEPRAVASAAGNAAGPTVPASPTRTVLCGDRGRLRNRFWRWWRSVVATDHGCATQDQQDCGAHAHEAILSMMHFDRPIALSARTFVLRELGRKQFAHARPFTAVSPTRWSGKGLRQGANSFLMVGEPGFEPGASSTQNWRADQTALHPDDLKQNSASCAILKAVFLYEPRNFQRLISDPRALGLLIDHALHRGAAEAQNGCGLMGSEQVHPLHPSTEPFASLTVIQA